MMIRIGQDRMARRGQRHEFRSCDSWFSRLSVSFPYHFPFLSPLRLSLLSLFPPVCSKDLFYVFKPPSALPYFSKPCFVLEASSPHCIQIIHCQQYFLYLVQLSIAHLCVFERRVLFLHFHSTAINLIPCFKHYVYLFIVSPHSDGFSPRNQWTKMSCSTWFRSANTTDWLVG